VGAGDAAEALRLELQLADAAATARRLPVALAPASIAVRGRIAFPDGAEPPAASCAVLLAAPAEWWSDEELFEVARAPLVCGGGFRVPIPAGMTRGWITLDAPGFVVSPALIGDVAAPREIVAQAVPSASLVVRLVPAPGLRADPRFLVGERITLFHAPATGGSRGRPAEIHAALQSDLTAVFPRLGCDRRYHASMCRPPFAPVRAPDLVLAPGEQRTLELALADGGALAGRVVDDAGHAIPGARVSCFTLDARGYAFREAGADGAFRLENLARGGTRIAPVEAAGFMTRILSDDELDRGLDGLELRLVLQVERRIRGAVRLPDGRAVAGARVTLGDPSDAKKTQSIASDAEGRFEFGQLTAGTRRLAAKARLATPTGGDGARVAAARTGTWRDVWVGYEEDVACGAGDVTVYLRPPSKAAR
jgi:hypothetical protein